MAKEYKLTAYRIQELNEELTHLKTEKMQEVIDDIREARSQGDLSENSEYDEARNEQAKLFGRIAEIEEMLAHAVVIEDENANTGKIGLGCTVEVRDMVTNEVMQFRITGAQEANPLQGRMSDDSPFGRALVGHEAGESVYVDAPSGRFEAQIISVTRG